MTREECNLSRDTLDVCGREIVLFGDYEQSFPESFQQLQSEHCRLINQSINCIHSYADNCIKKFSKTLIKTLLSKISKIVANRCTNDSESLIQLAPCLNKRMDSIRECMENFVTHLELIRDYIENKELLTPYTCCQIEDLRKCILNPWRTCGTNVVQLIDQLLGPFTEVVCPLNWEGFYRCPNLESIEPKSSDITVKALSPMVPLVGIFNMLAPVSPCVTARDKVDDCATHLFIFGDREQKFPSTVAELENSSCPLLNNSIKCMTQFGDNCLKASSPFMNQILESLISGANEQYMSRCVGVNRNMALSLSKCLNQQLDSMHSCYDNYVTELNKIYYQNNDREVRILYTCCRFHVMKKCTIRAAEEKCANHANNVEAINYLTKIIEKTSTNFLIKTCSDYWEGSAHCEALDPIDINQVKDINIAPSSAQSIVRPLINMFAINFED